MATLLLIEDDPHIQNMLVEKLAHEGYQTYSAYSGTEAELVMRQQGFDLILLDLMLPGKTGEEVLHSIRQISQVPVIVLSAKDSTESKIQLLNQGANDYMVKPYNLDELVARIEVQLRLHEAAPLTSTKTYKYGALTLDDHNHVIYYQDEEIDLTGIERAILTLFIKYPQKIFTKQEIFEVAWQDFYTGDDKTLSVHISNLRKKLKQYEEREWIETVWGIGFRLAR